MGRTHRATNSGEADLKLASEILSRDPRQTSGRLRRRILKLGGDIYITAVTPTGYVGGGIKVRLIAREKNITRHKFSVVPEGISGAGPSEKVNCRRQRFGGRDCRP